MAPTFALVQDGSLSGQASITDVQGQLSRDHNATSVTGSPDGTTYREVLGRFIWQLNARGYWDTGSRTYPLPIGTAASNAPVGRLSRVRLVKQQELINATAAGDGIDDIVFAQGVVRYFGSATGWLQSTETPIATTS